MMIFQYVCTNIQMQHSPKPYLKKYTGQSENVSNHHSHLWRRLHVNVSHDTNSYDASAFTATLVEYWQAKKAQVLNAGFTLRA